MSQLTPLTQSTPPATSTTAVPDSYKPLSPAHPHFHIQVLERRLLVTCLHRGLGQFSCFYLTKPHLTQEGYLKGAVQAENRTGPHCGGHTPLVSIPAELPESLASPLGYGFLFPPPLDMPQEHLPQENWPLALFVPCTSGRPLSQCL